MSKPLELTIFERHPGDGQPVYRVGGSFTPYAIVATEKRFTDAELAADYYREAWLHETSITDNDGYDGTAETRTHRQHCTTLWRFAELPHHDEDPQ